MLKPATAPVLLGVGCGLIVAAMFVHAFTPRLIGDVPAGESAQQHAAAADPDPAEEAINADSPPVEEPPATSPPEPESTQTGVPAPPSRPDVPGVPDIIAVTVPTGATGTTVSEALRQAGAVPDNNSFLQFMQERQATTRLREGTYVFSSGDSFEAILERLISGKTEQPDR